MTEKDKLKAIMNNSDLQEALKQMQKMLNDVKIDSKAVIMMPSQEGFKVYEIDENLGKKALLAQILKDKSKKDYQTEERSEKHYCNAHICLEIDEGIKFQCSKCGRVR